MSLAVYAIVGRSARAPVMRGVSNERLRLVRMGALAAVVGEIRRAPRPSEANLRKFASLIARLAAANRAILPARFGSTMRDDDEVEIVVGARQQSLRTQLARVRGRVQMTTRVVVEGEREKGKGKREKGKEGKQSGADYLRARAAASRAIAVPEFAPLHRAVAQWVRDERMERKGTVVTVYHLVPGRFATAYAGAIEKAALSSGARGFVSGPWPPYAFADGW